MYGCTKREINESPEKLLQETTEAIKHAKFVGMGDKPKVQQMLAELDWTMKTAMEEAEQAANAHTLSRSTRGCCGRAS